MSRSDAVGAGVNVKVAPCVSALTANFHPQTPWGVTPSRVGVGVEQGSRIVPETDWAFAGSWTRRTPTPRRTAAAARRGTRPTILTLHHFAVDPASPPDPWRSSGHAGARFVRIAKARTA